MGWGLGLGFVGVSRTRQDQRLGGGEERDNKMAERFMRTREAVQLVVASGSREKSEVIHGAKASGCHEVRPSGMAEVRCGGPGVGSQGRRGLSCVATLLVGRSVRFN